MFEGFVYALEYCDRFKWGQKLCLESGRTETAMKRLGLGAGFAIFLISFGVTALEVFQTRNWIKAAFWLAIGVAFLVADNSRKGESNIMSIHFTGLESLKIKKHAGPFRALLVVCSLITTSFLLAAQTLAADLPKVTKYSLSDRRLSRLIASSDRRTTLAL
jgi:hypothetical protein